MKQKQKIQRRPYMTKKRKKEIRQLKIVLFLAMSMLILSSLTNKPTRAIKVSNTINETTPQDYLVNSRQEVKQQAPQDYLVDSQKEDVEATIRRIAREENFKWTDYLVRLAKCESSLNPNTTNTKNNKPAYSKDRGLFQINDYWHKEVTDECAYDIDCSTRWTIKQINNGKQKEWVCDRIIKNKIIKDIKGRH